MTERFLFDKIKNLLLELIFPPFCLGCRKSATYLCQDCLALIDISNKIFKKTENLSGIYFACDYQNFIAKRLIRSFKYRPFVKQLAPTLSFLIITYLKNLEKQPEFLSEKQGFLLIPVPLYKKRLKWRGFNQAKEIAKILSGFFEIPLAQDVLFKIKETKPQTELAEEKRKQNLKGVFACQKPELIKNKKILLIDDVFTTGATMEEAAKTLKGAGVKNVWGVVVARG